MNPKFWSLLFTLAVFCTRRIPVMPGVSVPAWVPVLAVLSVLVLATGWLLTRTVPGFRSSPRFRIVIPFPQKERAA